MRTRPRFIVLFSVLVTAIVTSKMVLAQEPIQYELSGEQMRCLFEHQQKYLDLPRAVVLFTPAYCPAVTREEVARFQVQNSEKQGPGAKRLVFRKKDLRCLFQKIGVSLETLDGDGETNESISDVSQSFVLDCE